MPTEMLETIPGYGPDVDANREEARKLMAEGRATAPDKRLAGQGRDPQHPDLPRPRRHPDRPAEGASISTANSTWSRPRNWFAKVARKDYALGLNLTGNARRRSRPVVLRELCLRLGAQLHQLLQQGHREAVRRSSRARPTSPSARSWSGRSTRSCRRTSPARSSTTAARGSCWQPYVKGITIMVNSSYNGYRYEDVWMDK